MIAIINDFDAKLFEMNGIQYVRNFQAIKSGNNVVVSNAYDSRFKLVSANFSEYLVNGSTFASSDLLVSALSSILFIKDEVSAVTGESSNATSEAIFNNKDGTWINSPTNPLMSSTINLNLVNSKNGAVSPVYYKGNVLTKDNFTGGVIVFFSGVNTFNVLCAVWITYDKGSGAFHVNIINTFTGDLPIAPAIDTPDAPTQLILTEALTGVDTPAAPTQLILTEGTV